MPGSVALASIELDFSFYFCYVILSLLLNPSLKFRFYIHKMGIIKVLSKEAVLMFK